LDGGDSINYGRVWEIDNARDIPAYSSAHSGQFIEFPGRQGEYLFFHCPRGEYDIIAALGPMMVTHIGSDGRVIEKAVKLYEGEMQYFGFTKHANGRDYWLVVPKYLSNEFLIYLVNEDGIQAPSTQKTGPEFDFEMYAAGMNVFTPDGSTFIVNDVLNFTAFYHFDRCFGEITYNQHFAYAEGDRKYPIDYDLIASPDSRFLYISNSLEIFQYDLYANRIGNTRLRIANFNDRYNRFGNLNLPTTFTFFSRTPFNQIYCVAGNGNTCDHLIRNPNIRGLASDVIQCGIELPSLNILSASRFPYYELDKIEGSPCDTIPQLDGRIGSIKKDTLQLKSEVRGSIRKWNITPDAAKLTKKRSNNHVSIFPMKIDAISIWKHQNQIIKQWMRESSQ